MIEIIHLLLKNPDNAKCYFCGKPFKSSDFPIDGPDLIHIHHTSYVPEVKVLAHRKCHKKFHANLKKGKA